MARICVTIDRDGKTSVEVEGAQGERCKSLTAPLLKRLGQVTGCETKPEFYASPDRVQEVERQS